MLDLENSQTRELLMTSDDEMNGQVSPSGDWVAFVSNETGAGNVYVMPFDGGRGTVISTDGGHSPIWSGTDAELFYVGGRMMMSARLVFEPDIRVERSSMFDATYFVTGDSTIATPFDYDPVRDRFLMVSRDSGLQSHIRLATNWFEELERRVRTGGSR